MRSNKAIRTFVSLAVFFMALSCREKSEPISENEVVSSWAKMTLYLTQYTPANSPTYASRAIGYIGLTMYESVVPGYSEYQSVQSQLNGMPELPNPENGLEYNWKASFNAGQAEILKGIYMQTSDANKLKIDSLEALIEKRITDQVNDKAVMERSKAFGRKVASTIYEWSKMDGGHRAYLHNFDKEMKHPDFPGSWKPPLYAQSFSHHPLHPYWGENRTFLKENDSLAIPHMIPYDPAEGSDYYKQYLAVYEKDMELTQKDKEVAIWWGDDPDETFTPPGHSFYIATKAVEHYNVSLIKAAETYARVGMAVADAFRNCWKWKYHFFSERPNTFIPAFIDESWESFWPDPPFPAFPSGHAINAGAMATVMEDMYKPFTFTDSSHVNRERDYVRDVDFVPRTFKDFWSVAEETANSRFYGGIHTPQDNEVGLEEGRRIADHVNHLKWKK